MKNQEVLIHRIDSYYTWKVFSVLAAAFVAPVSLYYLTPQVNVTGVQTCALPIFRKIWVKSNSQPVNGFLAQYNLTAREMEILTLIFANQSTREIDATLHISPETVRKHYQNIYQKTGTHSKMELLLLYSNN